MALGCLLGKVFGGFGGFWTVWSSTPAVVPGAAPALAKAGVGGYEYARKYIHVYVYLYIYIYMYSMFKSFNCGCTIGTQLNKNVIRGLVKCAKLL